MWERGTTRGLVTDNVKAGSGRKLKTKEKCVIAARGEQSSDTRDWVAEWCHFHRSSTCAYVPTSTTTIHPSRLAAPSSGEWNHYNKHRPTGPNLLFRNVTSLSTCLVIDYKVLHSLTCTGNRCNFNHISVYLLVHLFNFLSFSLFSFSWIQKEKKCIFIFNFYTNIFLYFSTIFFTFL